MRLADEADNGELATVEINPVVSGEKNTARTFSVEPGSPRGGFEDASLKPLSTTVGTGGRSTTHSTRERADARNEPTRTA